MSLTTKIVNVVLPLVGAGLAGSAAVVGVSVMAPSSYVQEIRTRQLATNAGGGFLAGVGIAGFALAFQTLLG